MMQEFEKKRLLGKNGVSIRLRAEFSTIHVDKPVDKMLITYRTQRLGIMYNYLILRSYPTRICFGIKSLSIK